MKKVLLSLMLISVVACAGCVALTEKAEKVVVEKLYPDVEKKVVKYVEAAFVYLQESGAITADEVEQTRPVIYKVLVFVRDNLRHDIFGKEQSNKATEEIKE